VLEAAIEGIPLAFRFLDAVSELFDTEAEGLWDIIACWWTKKESRYNL